MLLQCSDGRVDELFHSERRCAKDRATLRRSHFSQFATGDERAPTRLRERVQLRNCLQAETIGIGTVDRADESINEPIVYVITESAPSPFANGVMIDRASRPNEIKRRSSESGGWQ